MYILFIYTEVYTYFDRKSKENLAEVPEISEESRIDTQSRVKEKVLKCREIQVNGLHLVQSMLIHIYLCYMCMKQVYLKIYMFNFKFVYAYIQLCICMYICISIHLISTYILQMELACSSSFVTLAEMGSLLNKNFQLFLLPEELLSILSVFNCSILLRKKGKVACVYV